MLYRIRTAKILPDGGIRTGSRDILYQHPTALAIGGLYVLGKLRRKRLYKIVAEVTT